MTRLVDADKLVSIIPPEEFIARYIVATAPTVDAVPVVHGRWKKTGRWGRVYRCDQCGNYLDFDGVNVGRGDANYCPNCGSRNRSEE